MEDCNADEDEEREEGRVNGMICCGVTDKTPSVTDDLDDVRNDDSDGRVTSINCRDTLTLEDAADDRVLLSPSSFSSAAPSYINEAEEEEDDDEDDDDEGGVYTHSTMVRSDDTATSSSCTGQAMPSPPSSLSAPALSLEDEWGEEGALMRCATASATACADSDQCADAPGVTVEDEEEDEEEEDVIKGQATILSFARMRTSEGEDEEDAVAAAASSFD